MESEKLNPPSQKKIDTRNGYQYLPLPFFCDVMSGRYMKLQTSNSMYNNLIEMDGQHDTSTSIQSIQEYFGLKNIQVQCSAKIISIYFKYSGGIKKGRRKKRLFFRDMSVNGEGDQPLSVN